MYVEIWIDRSHYRFKKLSPPPFLFDHEVDVSEISDPLKERLSSNKDQLRHLNPAKLPLIFAKSFHDSYLTVSFKNIHKMLLASLNSASNMFVEVKCCSELDVYCCPEETTSVSDARKGVNLPQRVSDLSNMGHEFEGLGGSAQNQHSPSSSASTSSFDVALEEIFSNDIDGVKANQIDEDKKSMLHAHDSGITTACCTNSQEDKTDFTVSGSDNEIDSSENACCSKGIIICIPITDAVQFHTFGRPPPLPIRSIHMQIKLY